MLQVLRIGGKTKAAVVVLCWSFAGAKQQRVLLSLQLVVELALLHY